jgi:hypothetical protein
MIGFVLVNCGTGSFVTHTESSLGRKPVALVWDNLEAARRHALSLQVEYAENRPNLRKRDRTWAVLHATDEQIQEALAVGAFGKDYAWIIRQHTEQFRARDLTPEVEQFREELDKNG